MRVAVLVGLLGISGCNQIFGLKATNEQDAPPPFEAGTGEAIEYRSIKLTKYVVDMTGVGAANHTTINTDLPLEADPQVQIGPIDQGTTAVPYIDGAVAVPASLTTADWRLVATLDGMPTEYQWKVGTGHITSSVSYGHQAPPPIPGGSSYVLNLPNAQTYKNYIFSTSGVWTELHQLSGGQSTPVSVALGGGEPLLGPLGAPQTSQGDWQLFVEQVKDQQCRPALGVAFQSADLTGSPTVTTPTYQQTTSVWPVPTIKGDGGGTSRFFALDQRYLGAGVSTYDLTEFGYVMKDGVPSFERTKLSNDVDHVATRRSLMVNLMDCRTGQPAVLPPYVDVAELAVHGAGERGMVKAIYLELTTQRRVAGTGPYLLSALQGISTSNAITLEAPLATKIAFDGLDLELINQTAAPDYKQTISVATPHQIPLTWQYEGGVQGVKVAPDDVTVILYNVTSVLTPIRVYHVTGTKVVVDSSVFDKTKYPVRDFVFEVIARVGAPTAAAGDYTTLHYPMSSASVFPYAFHVAP